jgi:hypothetical protein
MPAPRSYRTPEEAARASKERMAVSPPYNQKTPRGILPCVLIVRPGRQAYWAYHSAHGIKVPETYSKATPADIDRVRDWKAY